MKISDYVINLYNQGYSVEWIYHDLYRKFQRAEPPITLYQAHHLVEKSITDYLLELYPPKR